MDLTARLEYGTLALIDMANSRADVPVHAADIATRQSIPRPYLDQLLLALRRAGLVRSIRGPKGGHLLGRSASEMTLRDVYLALEGGSVDRTGRRRRDGSPIAEASGLRRAWVAAEQQFLEALSKTTIEDLASAVRHRRESPMYYI